jgi:hypothetical protein
MADGELDILKGAFSFLGSGGQRARSSFTSWSFSAFDVGLYYTYIHTYWVDFYMGWWGLLVSSAFTGLVMGLGLSSDLMFGSVI